VGAGCKVEYLPPYSPDFNPIEYSFSVIKKVVKDEYQIQGTDSPEVLGEKILRAAVAV
jgi:transposase